MEYMTVPEAAIRWKTGPTEVRRRCERHEIEGAIPLRKTWLIPENAQRPAREENFIKLWFK